MPKSQEMSEKLEIRAVIKTVHFTSMLKSTKRLRRDRKPEESCSYPELSENYNLKVVLKTNKEYFNNYNGQWLIEQK